MALNNGQLFGPLSKINNYLYDNFSLKLSFQDTQPHPLEN